MLSRTGLIDKKDSMFSRTGLIDKKDSMLSRTGLIKSLTRPHSVHRKII